MTMVTRHYHSARKAFLSTSCAVLAIASVMTAPVANAGEKQSYAIPAQSLEAVLHEFSRTTNINVLFSPDLTEGKKSAGLSGAYTTQEALDKLLLGSGLFYEMADDNTLYIRKRDLSMNMGDAAVGADDQAGEETAFVLEEIIVTATRREMNMQDVPMSMAAFGGDRLEDSGVVDITDVQFLAAGVQITDSWKSPRITMRGIGNNITQPGAESGIAVHRDGVYLNERGDLGLGFFDIERIEVVKGPQGTLYGRNATGGAVNVITKAPTTEFEAGGSATVGNYGLIETTGYMSGPIIGDKLLGRISFKTRDSEGYTPNLENGEIYNNADFSGVRARLTYLPTDNLTVDITADYASDGNIPARTATRFDPDVALPIENSGAYFPSGRNVSRDADELFELEARGLSAKVEWDLDDVILTSLSSYRHSNFVLSTDWDYTAVNSNVINISGDSKQISQELLLSSAGDQNLTWVVGGYYFTVDRDDMIILPLAGGAYSWDRDAELPIDAYAVFGEASYPIVDRLTLTLGARYSYEKRSLDHTIEIFGGVSEESLAVSWGSFTPKAALTYEISDQVSAYATVGKGFKSGGFNADAIQGEAFDPENVINYEVGIKTSLFDDRLRLNLSAYYMDYTDLQVRVVRINPITDRPNAVLTNAASAVIKGVDMDFEFRPTASLSLDGNVAYIDATYDYWPDAVDSLNGNQKTDVSGSRLLNSPKWSANAGVTYSATMGDWGTISWRGEYSYKTRHYFSPFERAMEAQPAYGILNTRLSLEEAEGKWKLSFWAKNITNELVSTERTATAVTNPVIIRYLPPRTYGVTVGYNF